MAPGETMSSAPARKAMARKGKRDGTLGRWWVALSFMRSISSRILLHEQPMMDGKQRQLEPVGGAHLVEDVRQVVLDRVLAQDELLGDLPVGEPRHHGGRDLELAGSESEARSDRRG